MFASRAVKSRKADDALIADDERIARALAKIEREFENSLPPWRRRLRRMVKHSRFDAMVLVAILLNCVAIAAVDPTLPEDSPRNAFIASTELYFTVFFTAEFIVRWTGLGNEVWASSFTYLDALILAGAYVSLIPGVSGGFTSLRAIRVLRPLRSVSRSQGMRTLVEALAMAMPGVSYVLGIFLFFLFVFGIFGLQLFSGVMLNQCVNNETNEPMVEGRGCVLGVNQTNPPFRELGTKTPAEWRAISSHICPFGSTCIKGEENPAFGFISFDNIGWAALTVLQSVSTEGWSRNMNLVIDSTEPIIAMIYFLLLVVFVAFFVLSHFVANVCVAYARVRADQRVRAARERRNKLKMLEKMQLDTPHVKLMPLKLSPHDEEEITPQDTDMGERESDHQQQVELHSAKKEASLNQSIQLENGQVLDTRQTSRTLSGNVKVDNNTVDHKSRESSSPPESERASSQSTSVAQKGTRPPPLQTPGFPDKIESPEPVEAASQSLVFQALLSVHHACKWLVNKGWFGTAVTVAILANTACLAIDHHGMSQSTRSSLETANLFFTIFFAAEMVLKIVGLLPRKYWQEKFNRLDACVVVMSLVELGIGSSGSVSVFRVLRLLRIARTLRLVRGLGTLRAILETAFDSVSDIGNFVLLLVLMLFIFALLGMSLFGGKLVNKDVFDPSIQPPRANFDTFWWSFVTVFQVMSKEGWETVLYNSMNATHASAALFFIILLLFSHYVLLSLFLGTLLEKFSEFFIQSAASRKTKAVMSLAARLGRRVSTIAAAGTMTDTQKKENARWLKAKRKWSKKVGRAILKARKKGWEIAPGLLTFLRLCGRDAETLDDEDSDDENGHQEGEQDSFLIQQLTNFAYWYQHSMLKVNIDRFWEWGQDLSLFLFSKETRVRKLAQRFDESKKVEQVVQLMTAISSIQLAVEHPDDDGQKKEILFYLDVVVTLFFVIESVLKIVSRGLMMNKKSYLRSGWNFLDAFIVVVSVLSIIFTNNSLKSIRVLRILRVLRPLRALSKWKGMQAVAGSIVESITPVSNVLLIYMLSLLVFSILGVQLFNGRFWYCNNSSSSGLVDCFGHFTDPLSGVLMPAVWDNPDRHFDNTLRAFLVMFEISTFENWPLALYSAVDAVGEDQQPVRDAHPEAAVFFIVAIIVNSFFMLNILITVVIGAYMKATETNARPETTSTDMDLLSPNSRANRTIHMVQVWNLVEGAAPSKQSQDAKSPKKVFFPRRVVQRLVSSVWFTAATSFVIFANVITLSLEYYNQPTYWTEGLEAANLAFTCAFTAEIALKLVALGVKGFFLDSWNVFDFVITGASVAELFIDLDFINPTAIRVFRIFRVLRVAKLVNKAKGLKTVLATFVNAMPSLVSVGAMLLLVFFIFAAMGVRFFGKVRPNRSLGGHTGFESFGKALLTLFRISTGEKWGTVMIACMIQEPYCSSEYEECGSNIAPLYFLTFVVVAFVTLNLFVAVILSAFFKEIETGPLITAKHVDAFTNAWSRVDPGATGTAPAWVVQRMLRPLAPLFADKYASSEKKWWSEVVIKRVQAMAPEAQQTDVKLPKTHAPNLEGLKIEKNGSNVSAKSSRPSLRGRFGSLLGSFTASTATLRDGRLVEFEKVLQACVHLSTMFPDNLASAASSAGELGSPPSPQSQSATKTKDQKSFPGMLAVGLPDPADDVPKLPGASPLPPVRMGRTQQSPPEAATSPTGRSQPPVSPLEVMHTTAQNPLTQIPSPGAALKLNPSADPEQSPSVQPLSPAASPSAGAQLHADDCDKSSGGSLGAA